MKGQRKIFISCPAAQGTVETDFTLSLLYTVAALGQQGIASHINFIRGCAEISIARSIMLQDFLASDCEWFLSIDSDLGWDPSGVVNMLATGHEFIAGCYPAKVEGEIQFQHYGLEQSNTGELLVADKVPGGFILLRRRVAERMVKHYSELDCTRNGNKFSYLYMPMIVPREDGTLNALGEDYAFCHRWRAMGGKIFVYPDIDFNHYGKRAWQGNLLNDTRWADDDDERHSDDGSAASARGEPAHDDRRHRSVGKSGRAEPNDARLEGQRS